MSALITHYQVIAITMKQNFYKMKARRQLSLSDHLTDLINRAVYVLFMRYFSIKASSLQVLPSRQYFDIIKRLDMPFLWHHYFAPLAVSIS